MFTNSPMNGAPSYGPVGRQGQRLGVGWAVMVPGLLLTLFALAILVWPHLLAYLVAAVLLFVGLLLTIWGWSIRRAEQQRSIQHTVRYDVF